MNDFQRHAERYGAELKAAMQRVLDSGWYILGKEVEAFEQEFAAYLGVPHAVGVGNGMDALQLALMAWDIGPGHEVITTPNSAFATALSILRVGAKPVFVDISESDYALDVSQIEAAITPRTRAIMPVHIYGRAANLSALTAIAQQHGLALINDACQAHGAGHRGRDIAGYGQASAYSFYPTKNLGALGDGGMVVCADAERARRMRSLRDYGQAKKYHHAEPGLNSRLDELQAAILRTKLAHLPAQTERRRSIAQRYNAGLAGISLILPFDDAEAVWHLFVLRSPRRDALSGFLRERGVQSLVHYPVIIPEQPALRTPYMPGTFPVAERCAAEFLSLPIDPELTDAEVDAVIAAVRAFFETA
jgi:dTDP-3-amino-3,4,6-trideoxy-alpha-D-glucose transaminase